MGKKIVVAGLGHGGIAAAAQLAKAGFEISLSKKRSHTALAIKKKKVNDKRNRISNNSHDYCARNFVA